MSGVCVSTAACAQNTIHGKGGNDIPPHARPSTPLCRPAMFQTV